MAIASVTEHTFLAYYNQSSFVTMSEMIAKLQQNVFRSYQSIRFSGIIGNLTYLSCLHSPNVSYRIREWKVKKYLHKISNIRSHRSNILIKVFVSVLIITLFNLFCSKVAFGDKEVLQIFFCSSFFSVVYFQTFLKTYCTYKTWLRVWPITKWNCAKKNPPILPQTHAQHNLVTKYNPQVEHVQEGEWIK